MKDIPLYILGSGAMALAMAKGLRSSGFKLVIVGRDKARMSEFKDFVCTTYAELGNLDALHVILAFKPHALQGLSSLIMGQPNVVFSPLANVGLNSLHDAFGTQNIVRFMPNIAAAYNASITPYVCMDKRLAPFAQELLGGFGQALMLANEKELELATGIAGSAPAFLALVAEALMQGGVSLGLHKELSKKLVQGMFKSSAALIEHSHPALIKEQICSPAGISIKGVNVLEQRAMRSAFIDALIATNNKGN